MTAIEGLLEKAGELHGAGLEEFYPALVELAAIQGSMADLFACYLDAMPALSGMGPFIYGFSIPAEPPEIKADAGEPVHEAGRAEVNVGPIDVRAIMNEVRKAVEGVGRESADIPAAVTAYATPGALPRAAEGPKVLASGQRPEIPGPAIKGGARTPAEAVIKPARHAEEWVEKSIRRSSVVMNDLSVLRQNIVDRTITVEDVHRMSAEASSIGAMAPAPQLKAGEPAGEGPLPRPGMPERKAEAPVAVSSSQKVTEVPPIRPRPKIIPLAEEAAKEAAHNARSLSDALAKSVESARPPVFPETSGHEPAVNVEWPGASAQAIRPANTAGAPAGAPVAPPYEPPPIEARLISQPTARIPSIVSVAKSLGAMDEYVRAVAEVGLRSSTIGGNSYISNIIVPGMEGGRALIDAAAVTLQRPDGFPIEYASSHAAALEVPQAAVPGLPQANIRPGPAPAMAAFQPARSPGISIIHQLIRSAPAGGIMGVVVHQAPSVYGDVLSWAPPVSQSAAAGAENIVNVLVPQAGPAMQGDGGTTNKVSNFHNTFNITINVKGGEERDLRDLGKKIGQILSDEIRRYGGLS